MSKLISCGANDHGAARERTKTLAAKAFNEESACEARLLNQKQKKIQKNEEKHTKCAAARMLECVPYENECLLLGVQRRRKRKTAALGHAKYGTRINHVS